MDFRLIIRLSIMTVRIKQRLGKYLTEQATKQFMKDSVCRKEASDEGKIFGQTDVRKVQSH
jgi:hypothetical protein